MPYNTTSDDDINIMRPVLASDFSPRWSSHSFSDITSIIAKRKRKHNYGGAGVSEAQWGKNVESGKLLHGNLTISREVITVHIKKYIVGNLSEM